MLKSSAWKSLTATKLSLECDDKIVIHILLDESYAYIAITAPKYPSKILYGTTGSDGFFNDFKNYVFRYKSENVNWYSSNHKKWFEQLYSAYAQITENKIEILSKQLDDIKIQMVENIDTVLKRGENIDILVDKSDQLNNDADKFRKSSKTLEKNMKCRNWKITAIITGIVLVVLAIIIIAIVV
jgi:hypothetical protein